jgi:hypothetical protein
MISWVRKKLAVTQKGDDEWYLGGSEEDEDKWRMSSKKISIFWYSLYWAVSKRCQSWLLSFLASKYLVGSPEHCCGSTERESAVEECWSGYEFNLGNIESMWYWDINKKCQVGSWLYRSGAHTSPKWWCLLGYLSIEAIKSPWWLLSKRKTFTV